jgi:thiol:disulfide interchange protein DsbD
MKHFFLLSYMLMTLVVGAQNPIKWTYDVKPLGGDEYNLVFRGAIEDGWATYSQNQDKDDGPKATTFDFEDGAHYKRIGKAEESGGKKVAFDKVFGMDVAKFLHDAIFTQKVKVSDPKKPIKGYFTYMACNDKSCLPPKDVDFSFTISSAGATKQDVPPPVVPIPTNKTVAGTQSVPAPIAPTTAAIAKGESPVKWAFESKKISDTEYDLILKAVMANGWSTYSQFIKGDGPSATEINFAKDANVTLQGAAKESGHVVEGFDKVFGMNIKKFKDEAIFTQRVKVADASKPVKGYVSFMTCDNTKCLPPTDVDFTFNLGADTNTGSVPPVTLPDDPNRKGTFDSKRNISLENPTQVCGFEDTVVDKGLWWVFFAGFLGGLFALLTPCVFPMIPLTVSFFTKSSTTRAKGISNAILYGLSIIVIYVSIGIILTSIFGPTVLNEMSTDMYFNIMFFIVFVIFAISFFGYYEITLPSAWANKADAAADKSGGIIGIFFMAFTLSLVSFSCTGPIIGTLLVQTVQSSQAMLLGFIPLKPFLGMFGFSLALALPFGLFAAFPSWLNSLPRSGSWMTNVKVTLGFLELALALKFLSTADMVRHWGLVKLEVFLIIWILLFIGLALYQFGFIKFPHDGPLKKITTGRWITGGLALLFAGYLCTGFTYKPLSLLSGLAPPVHYSIWGPQGCAHGLECYHDFDEALAVAQKLNKPLFVDFTGYGCVNCRKVEENVWIKPEILKHLQEDYVVVSLYVDDQARLFPDDKQSYLLDTNTGDKIRTVGGKWASFQINNFGLNSQPQYVLMGNDGKTVLTTPIAFDGLGDAYNAKYKKFLECGLEGFKKMK